MAPMPDLTQRVAVAHAPWHRHPGESPYWEEGFVERLVEDALKQFVFFSVGKLRQVMKAYIE